MSPKHFPVQRLAGRIVITLVLALLSIPISSLARSSWVLVTSYGTSVAQISNAVREKLVNIHACASITQNELISLAVCDVGHADKKTRVKSRIVCLFDIVEDSVSPPYRFSEPFVASFEYLITIFCSDQPWPR